MFEQPNDSTSCLCWPNAIQQNTYLIYHNTYQQLQQQQQTYLNDDCMNKKLRLFALKFFNFLFFFFILKFLIYSLGVYILNLILYFNYQTTNISNNLAVTL